MKENLCKPSKITHMINEILNLIKKGKIFEIGNKDIGSRLMSKEEMIAIFNHFDAFWEYDGSSSPEKPHALLKSGKHSNGFIVCNNVLKYPKICGLLATEMLKHVKQIYSIDEIDVVVSSAYSAINLGYELSTLMSLENPDIEYIITEKDSDGNPTKIRGGIDPSKKVLIINELMTTRSGSTWETKTAVQNCNGENPAPQILHTSFVLVHRSKDYELPDGSKVHPIFHFDIENYEKEECPYCEAGSEAIKPKIGNNWNIIHGRN